MYCSVYYIKIIALYIAVNSNAILLVAETSIKQSMKAGHICFLFNLFVGEWNESQSSLQ